MPPITFPNQRMVRVHRERAASDFLGIKNENWQAASRDLGAHALQLYLYLASNANKSICRVFADISCVSLCICGNHLVRQR